VERLVVETRQKNEFVDITRSVAEVVKRNGGGASACLVFSSHTTAGITINEHADPAVAEDMLDALGGIVAKDVAWRHLEGNSPAHVKASLVGSSATIPVMNGAVRLGRWQGIFLCEFDGPRTREVWIQFLK
jgi:secondary thiamine-phosphate synthase enzyme